MAFIECPSCGERTGNLKTHICRKGNGSGGLLAKGATLDLARVGKVPQQGQRAEQQPSTAIVPKRSSTVEPAAHNGSVAGSSPAASTKLKRGRPKIEGKRLWELEGISRRTWYRRQREQKEGGK